MAQAALDPDLLTVPHIRGASEVQWKECSGQVSLWADGAERPWFEPIYRNLNEAPQYVPSSQHTPLENQSMLMRAMGFTPFSHLFSRGDEDNVEAVISTMSRQRVEPDRIWLNLFFRDPYYVYPSAPVEPFDEGETEKFWRHAFRFQRDASSDKSSFQAKWVLALLRAELKTIQKITSTLESKAYTLKQPDLVERNKERIQRLNLRTLFRFLALWRNNFFQKPLTQELSLQFQEMYRTATVRALEGGGNQVRVSHNGHLIEILPANTGAISKQVAAFGRRFPNMGIFIDTELLVKYNVDGGAFLENGAALSLGKLCILLVRPQQIESTLDVLRVSRHLSKGLPTSYQGSVGDWDKSKLEGRVQRALSTFFPIVSAAQSYLPLLEQVQDAETRGALMFQAGQLGDIVLKFEKQMDRMLNPFRGDMDNALRALGTQSMESVVERVRVDNHGGSALLYVETHASFPSDFFITAPTSSETFASIGFISKKGGQTYYEFPFNGPLESLWEVFEPALQNTDTSSLTAEQLAAFSLIIRQGRRQLELTDHMVRHLVTQIKEVQNLVLRYLQGDHEAYRLFLDTVAAMNAPHLDKVTLKPAETRLAPIDWEKVLSQGVPIQPNALLWKRLQGTRANGGAVQQKIEDVSLDVVETGLASRGYQVRPRTKDGTDYDLEAFNANERLKIEVKGIPLRGQASFFVRKNQLQLFIGSDDAPRDPNALLALVVMPEEGPCRVFFVRAGDWGGALGAELGREYLLEPFLQSSKLDLWR